MLQYILLGCISLITIFFLILSYKFVKDFSNTTLPNKGLITVLSILLIILFSYITMIVFDINLITQKLYVAHSDYILVTLSAVNITVFVIMPYIYFFLESIRNSEEESKDINSTESCKFTLLLP